MALAKRTLIFAVVGVIVLAVGIIGGAYMGLRYFMADDPVVEGPQVSDPGPMVELGEFTANLADTEPHLVKMKITIELTSLKTQERLVDPGWLVRMKDEVLKTLKNQRYDSIRYAEGMEMLKQDLRARLNELLPKTEGKVAVDKVLVGEFLVQ